MCSAKVLEVQRSGSSTCDRSLFRSLVRFVLKEIFVMGVLSLSLVAKEFATRLAQDQNLHLGPPGAARRALSRHRTLFAQIVSGLFPISSFVQSGLFD